jgi:3'(2'), 5'-bisphosphate nucleotidase
VFILSEESVSAGPAQADTFFLVDPLDGTKEFLKRNGEFTVNIALIQAGRPVAGVVLAPATGVLYAAAFDVGAWRRNAQGETVLQVATRAAGDSLRIIGSRSHAAPEMQAWLDALGAPHEFVAVGSSLKFCRIAEGAADIYPRFGLTSQWDTAAGQCVLEVAGGTVTSLSGESLLYGLERPVLNPHFFAFGAGASAALCMT